jgi:hypothetical protein
MNTELLGYGILALIAFLMPLTGAILLNFATLDTRSSDNQYRFTVKYPLIILSVSLICFVAGVFLQEFLHNAYNCYMYGVLLLITDIVLVSITGSFYNFKKKNQYNSSIGVSDERSTPKEKSVSLLVKFIVTKIKEIYIEFNIYFEIFVIFVIYIIVSEDLSYLHSSVKSISDLLYEREMILSLMANALQLIISAVILYGLFKKYKK